MFDYEAFRALLKAKNVTSIEQMAEVLPQSYRDNFALVRDSGSLQSGYDHEPRVIAFGNSVPRSADRLYIAYQSSADVNSKSPQSVEVFEWLPIGPHTRFTS